MDRRQRYVGMLAAYGPTDLIAARMSLGGEERFYDRKPLRCDGDSLLTAAGDEITQSLDGILFMPSSARGL